MRLPQLDHDTSDTLQAMVRCSYWRRQPLERVAAHLDIDPRYVAVARTYFASNGKRFRPRSGR